MSLHDQVAYGGIPLDAIEPALAVELGYMEPNGRPADVFDGFEDRGDLEPVSDCPAYECVEPGECHVRGRCAFATDDEDDDPLGWLS